MIEISIGDRMTDNSNFWKFLGTVKKLREKENKCFICGSSENIVPHHIRKVKQTSDEYYNENNIVLLCERHHHHYHKQYPNVNQKTFCEFLRDNLVVRIKEKEIKKLKNKRGVNMDFDLNKPLKISKLRKVIKLVNKTNHKKTVKISVNDRLYGFRNICVKENIAIFKIHNEFEDFSSCCEIDDFVMNIDLNEDLRISKFRKILNLISHPNKKIIKISLNGDLYDVTQIKDREDATIFVVGDFKKIL